MENNDVSNEKLGMLSLSSQKQKTKKQILRTSLSPTIEH